MLPPDKKFVPNAKDYLNGVSPIEQSKIKKRRVCRWCLNHGAMSADLIKSVAGQKSNGLAKQYVNCGLLIETRTKSGTPRFFYTLTQPGEDLANCYASYQMDYNKYRSPLKISQANFDHDFQVQKLSLLAISQFGMKYVSQAQLSIRHTTGVKVPDALWIDANKIKIAIEVEYSQKFGRILDNTISAMIQSLIDHEYDCYYFFVRSTVIQTNYLAAMQGGRELNRYVKNDKNRWVKDLEGARIIPDWFVDRVFFMLADQPLIDLPNMEQMLGL